MSDETRRWLEVAGEDNLRWAQQIGNDAGQVVAAVTGLAEIVRAAALHIGDELASREAAMEHLCYSGNIVPGTREECCIERWGSGG